jgi:predicted GNAT family N-acyltransferase
VIVEVVDGALTRELRRRILRPAWPVGSPMHGDGQPGVLHIAARSDDATVVGACVLIPRPRPGHPDEPAAWQLRGMATAEGLRGHGIGSAVVDEAVRQVGERGARLLWCDARQSAVAFYARHGFVGEGEIFQHAETGIPHLRMVRELFGHPGPSTK